MSDTQVPTILETTPEQDLAAMVRQILEKSEEPMTLPKIRAALPVRLRATSLEGLADMLRRQVAANVVHQFPKYRSQHDRFWDRPMAVHVACLVRQALMEKPLALAELRRLLPDYAKSLAETVLQDQLAQGKLFQHPPASKRTGPRFGNNRPDPREYLRPEMARMFQALEGLGFTQTQLREGAMDLLHQEEWATTPTQETVAAQATMTANVQPEVPDQEEPVADLHAATLPESQS